MTGIQIMKVFSVQAVLLFCAISLFCPLSVVADPSIEPADENAVPSDAEPADATFDETETPETDAPEEELQDWTVPTAAEVRSRLVEWIESQTTDSQIIEAALAAWPAVDPAAEATDPGVEASEPTETEMIERLAASFAVVDSDTSDLIRLCGTTVRIAPPIPEWLADEKRSAFLRDNMRLLVGRWMVHNNLYDEAGNQMNGITPRQVVAPATLLFFQSVVHHRLLEKEEGLKVIDHLLTKKSDIPRRYAAVAQLMRDDLDELKDDSLDHIARRMDDIRRRMDLGRAGPRVREIEDGVIESLDDLIKKIEEQQCKKCSSSGSGNIQSSRPAQESRIMGGNGPGHVTRRNIGSGADWGDLPPQEREAALQQIGRDFPSHYRDVIEQYFRRLASEKIE